MVSGDPQFSSWELSGTCVLPCRGAQHTKGSRLRDWGNEESAGVLPACRAKETQSIYVGLIAPQTGVKPQREHLRPWQEISQLPGAQLRRVGFRTLFSS